MVNVKISFENPSYNFVTRINGTEHQIREYYLNQRFNMTLDGVTDNIQTCIGVEIIEVLS